MFAFVSVGADTKANTLELVRVPSSPLQRLQRGVALESLGESGSCFRAEAVARETASMGAEVGAEGCQWALTERRTLGSWFERRAAYFSDCSVELPLSPSARATPPSGPRLLKFRLRGGVQRWCGVRALTRKRTRSGGGAPEGGDLRLLEDGSERRAALGSDVVGSDTAKHAVRLGL